MCRVKALLRLRTSTMTRLEDAQRCTHFFVHPPTALSDLTLSEKRGLEALNLGSVKGLDTFDQRGEMREIFFGRHVLALLSNVSGEIATKQQPSNEQPNEADDRQDESCHFHE